MFENNILGLYLEWYLADQPKLILKGWRNFLNFNLNYFSIPLLLRTLFSPWRKYQMTYGRGVDFGRYFETFVFNAFSRVIGLVMRIILIVSGVILEAGILLVGLFALVVWYLHPFILVFALMFSLRQIFF